MYNTQVKFGNTIYYLNPDIKKYALRDRGFKQTLNKSFKYERPIYLDSPYKPIGYLKININSSLTKFDMLVTGQDKMTKLNVFNNSKLNQAIRLIDYILEDLIEHSVLTKKKEE